MADDVTLPGTGAVVATRDKGGREVQLVQLDLGDGTTVAPAEGALPVTAAALPLPSGAATAAHQVTANAALGAPADAEAAGDGSLIGLLKRLRALLGGTLAVSGPVTDAQLRATAVPVSLTGVATAANQTTQTTALGAAADAEATGNGSIIAILKRLRTLLGGTLAVSGPVTDAQLRATAVPVSVGLASTDGSTTITTGGTAQSLFGGATPTNGYSVFNPDTGDLWFSDSTTAAANGTGSIRVPPNGYYCTEPGQKPIQAVSIIGATTGQKITARRW